MFSRIFDPIIKLATFVMAFVFLFGALAPTPQAHAVEVNESYLIAQNCKASGDLGRIQIIGICDIPSLITALTDFLLALAPILAVLVLIWGGYKYFFSAFTGEKVAGARAIQAGVVGLIITIVARPLVGRNGLVWQVFRQDGTLDATPIVTFITTQLTGTLSVVAGAMAVLVIIWGGYKYYFSTFPGQQKDGRETIIQGVIGLIVILTAQPLVALVRATIGTQNERLVISGSSVIGFIQLVVTNFMLPVSVAVTVFCFIWGAYNWITAGGDPGKVKKGQDYIRNSLIGLVVALLATTITQLIIYFVRGFGL